MADNAGSTFLLPSIDQIVSAAPNHNDASANNMKYSKRINTPTMEHPSQGDNPGSTKELDEEISRRKAALVADAPPDSDPSNQSEPLASKLKLTRLLRQRYRQTGSLEDLNEALACTREVLSALSPDEAHFRPQLLNFCAWMLSMRFESTGEIQDLNEAVSMAKDALSTLPPTDPERESMLSRLSSLLQVRFEAVGDPRDLNEAVEVASVEAFGIEKVLHARSDDHPQPQPQPQQQQHKPEPHAHSHRVQQIILDRMRKAHYPHAGVLWATLTAEERAAEVSNIYKSIRLAEPQTLEDHVLETAFRVEHQTFTYATNRDRYFEVNEKALKTIQNMKDSKQSSLLWNDVDIGHTGRQLGMDEELLGNLPPDVAETREIDGDEDFSVLFPDDEATLKQLPRDSGYGSSAGMASKEDQANDDTRSINSVVTNAPRIQLGMEEEENLVSAFAADLCQDMQIDRRLEGEHGRMLPRLHSLLKGFSVRLQEKNLSMNERNAAEFVRQQRENIASRVRKAYGKINAPEDDGPKSPLNDGMTGEEKMAIWPIGDISEPPPPEVPPVEDKQDSTLGSPRYQQVRAFLRESSAYSWLLEKARISASLTDTTGTLQTITSTLDDLFRSMRERSLTGPIFNSRFEIDWDLPGFLRCKNYDTTLDIAFEQAITLTGGAQDAQAMTCVDYISQAWPSSGPEVFKALQEALRSPNLLCQTCLLDGTELEISLQSPRATVFARGGRAALTELCEQLTWLGAALGAGPEDTSQPSRLWIATPAVAAFNSGELYTKRPSIAVRIRFPIRPIPDDSLAEGTCWHTMFHHPVVVDGFPIVARPDHQKGLEISTRIMGALAGSEYATHYAETMVLKGFCSMLVPTACMDGSITWHYLYNQDGSWLPYNSFREECASVVPSNVLDSDMLNRENMRNFVGWASSIARNLGTEGMNYGDIGSAGAPECSPGVAVEKKLTISVSKLFGTSATFVRGDRDKSLICRKDPYPGKVNAARRLPVLFYDRATKRGWLVDGASALLHIARSQVVHPPYSESSHFNDTAVNSALFKHPKAEDGPKAASEMLKDQENQQHIINSEFGGFEQGQTDLYGRPKRYRRYNSFNQLVSDTWDTLDQIYSRQDEVKKSQTQQLRIPSYGLEGYEYMDVVSLRSSLTRRHVDLHGNGSEWSSFVRKINAITLFGQHFGEIYTPNCNESLMCAPWRTVPVDHEYLTAPISLLKELNEHMWEDGKISPESPEIAKHVLWTPSEDAFRICTGETENCVHEFHERVQRLVATFNIRKSLGMSRKSVPHKDDTFAMQDGAVIFGNSSQLRDAGACYSDSEYNSSHAASFSVAGPAGGSSDAGDGSSITVQTSVPGVASTESERRYDMSSCARCSPITTSPPLSSGERPTTAPGSSDGAMSTVSQTNCPLGPASSRTAQQSSAAAAPSGKPTRRELFKLREALLIRKLRKWRHKIRPETTSK